MNINKLDKEAVISAYDAEDWGSLPNFAGNFINFGYWQNILAQKDTRPLTLGERIQSSYDMYKKIADYLNISPSDTVLEVGSGRGVGTVYIAKTYHPKNIVGIDMTPSQIKTALKITSQNILHDFNIQFLCLDAEGSNIGTDLFDKIYSIEIFQHILSIDKALLNIYNALKKNGTLVISTYFLTEQKNDEEIKKLFPLAQTKQEYPISIDELYESLNENLFKDIEIIKIGDAVFHGYEKWITQERVDTSLSHRYYDNYCTGDLDYYVIKATKR